MKRSSPEIRRALLKPLIRRRVSPTTSTRIETAFRELEERAIASALLPQMVDAQKKARIDTPKGRWKDPEVAQSRVLFASAMHLARRISFQEYILLVAHAAEGVHDARIMNGDYPELENLSASMQQVQVSHGLAPDEFWSAKDAPPEYLAMSEQWDASAQRRLGEILIELEGSSAASLFHESQIEFDRLRERGRRSFFHSGELLHALADTIKRYEQEARASARAGAFTAAVTLLGASVEGLLLLRCLRSRIKAAQIASMLPTRSRPRDVNSPAKWSFDILIQVCLHAGWLPVIDTPTISIHPDGLAHTLRKLRNFIHPGKVCVDRPWIEAERRDFEDAETIYTTLFATVFKGAAIRRYAASAPSIGDGNSS